MTDFTSNMITLLEKHIDLPDEPHDKKRRRVRIAVLGIGLLVDERDVFLSQRKERVIKCRNFVDTRSGHNEDCTDTNGHRTHVVRLLMKFAARADIVVAKVAERIRFQITSKNRAKVCSLRLVAHHGRTEIGEGANFVSSIPQALRWVGENADIINLGWNMGRACPAAYEGTDLGAEITRFCQ